MQGTRIGAGLQYIVYATGDGRVTKVPAGFFHKVRFCIALSYPPLEILSSIRSVDKLARDSIAELRGRGAALPSALLGNPIFGDGITYEQDRITPVGKYLETSTLEEKKRIFDGYIQNTLALWEYGIADTVFNFTFNNGVTSTGEVILADLGELTFSKDVIAELVEEKMWLGQRSFTETKKSDPELSAYIESEMARHITPQSLDVHFRYVHS